MNEEPQIPLHEPYIDDKEREAVLSVLDSGYMKAGGKYEERCSNIIQEVTESKYTLLTSSCTHSLETASLLLDVKPGDEVILPSFTFPSTATAFYNWGADIKFCEIRRDTLNMDPEHLKELITPETKAVIPVHYAGIGCEMDEITSVCAQNDVAVVEDAAQAFSAEYKGEPLGSVGDMGCFSFHGTKNYVAGEGGAFVTDDEDLAERAECIRQKGTNYSKFKRGEVEKYTWVDKGSSYVPSELQNSVLWVQLKKHREINTERKRVYQYYNRELADLEDENLIKLPEIPPDRKPNYHIYHIRVENGGTRDRLISFLRESGVGTASHYEPLHLSKCGREMGYEKGDLPITEKTSNTLLRLPIYPGLENQECEKVTRKIKEFYSESLHQ